MKKQTSSGRYRATHLAAVLEEQGRRRDWLAATVGISPALVSMILSGERWASEDVAERIARALGVPLFLVFELPSSSKQDPIGATVGLLP